MRRAIALGCALGCFAAAPAMASSGLVANWHFNEGSGTVVHDSSGYGNNGTLSGGVTWTQGKYGDGLAFDGTGEVDVTDSSSLEPPSAVTVSAWVKASASPGQDRYIVAKGAQSCNAASYGLYTGTDGGIAFYVSQNDGESYVISPDPGTGIWDGNWHFVVGTYDGSMVRLYVDGVQVGSGTPETGPIGYGLPTSDDLVGGNYAGCDAHGFVGDIDEAAIWSKALNTTAIQTEMACPSYGDPGLLLINLGPNGLCLFINLNKDKTAHKHAKKAAHHARSHRRHVKTHHTGHTKRT
jgi:hypothetical protein